ncbi:uncharacterized protein KY384_004917 [Bacidia gigantensis]|uniref:uncharacterized protein n=1 Tax=Bacidia gigantensis TaxID=2732470 RepID=UPI001D03C5AC|nr:uncharacterized protein KY384_004917 [Bacidia gigantensis]KAG8530415.1 hypothetical protein KY384_004917 [Bacidia gigantensis]
MASEATPRVNAKYLETFTNQTVRILGKVTSLRGELATIDAQGSVNVTLNRDAHLQMGNAAEIVGKVQQDLSVRAFQAVDFGSNIGELCPERMEDAQCANQHASCSDFNAVEAVVDATHRYKEIFYESGD